MNLIEPIVWSMDNAKETRDAAPSLVPGTVWYLWYNMNEWKNTFWYPGNSTFTSSSLRSQIDLRVRGFYISTTEDSSLLFYLPKTLIFSKAWTFNVVRKVQLTTSFDTILFPMCQNSGFANHVWREQVFAVMCQPGICSCKTKIYI